jgi:hypothetical protein
MKISLVLTDEQGITYEGNATLLPVSTGGQKRRPVKLPAGKSESSISFNHNPRAFMKKYGNGLGGTQKFTLLLARLTEGETNREITLGDIQKSWNRMKPLMGGPFNGAHSIRARDHGWVDTSKRGVYLLTDSWKEALMSDND